MTVENELLRIGQELKKCRDAKGMTIEKLAAKTKISVKFIRNFEEGQFDFLPDVYIQAFLKSLAAEVGLDKNVILRQYRAASEAETQEKAELRKKTPFQDGRGRKTVAPEILAKLALGSSQSTERRANDSPGFINELKNIGMDSKKIGILTVGGLGLVLLVFIFFSLPTNENSTSVRRGDHKSQKSADSPLSADSTAQMQLRGDSSVSTLTVKALQNTWLRIVFDDSLADEATFGPGDIRSWQSHGIFYLRIGNVGGVELILNGKNLGPAGEGPQIANLQVDEEGVKSIAASEFPSVMLATRIP